MENIFFHSFFYSSLSGVILSTFVVTIILIFFRNENYDKRTYEKIINLGKKNSEMTINTINIILTTKFLKVQSSLNELILYYQKISKEILVNKNKNLKLDNKYLKCVLNLNHSFCDTTTEDTLNLAYWLVDSVTNEEQLELKENQNLKKQLIAYSKIIPSLITNFDATNTITMYFYFFFDKTELFTSFPIYRDCLNGLIDDVQHYYDKEFNCINDKGEIITTYNLKCEFFFSNMLKSRTASFDNNYLANQNKTIFITNYYDNTDLETLDIEMEREFSMCIEFDDYITEGKGYACADVLFEDMYFFLDSLSSKMVGYYFIMGVGFNNVFYFPKRTVATKTSTENIFKWNINFKLEEKIYFHEAIRKILSSNYIDNINEYNNKEVFVNGKNPSGQFFYVNREKFKYSIYPIVLENLNGKKEHIMSIIYIYKEESFFEQGNNNSSIIVQIFLVLIFFIVFGFGILYIIYLTLKTLAKYIVIPIKNLNYMLKGINIGGKDRLNYLDYLKKKQDDNIEKLTNNFLYEINNNKEKSNNEYSKDKNNNINEKEKIYIDFEKKYDKESKYIEKECNFYDFDEQLLQYRPLEIKNLIKSLFEFKATLELASSDREIEQIINYSHSEQIFKNFKNKEGATICQSNIGNLQNRLLKYDKAIYHLALSLQDNKLKRFLNQNLNDEFDEDDSLLYKISNLYNKEKKREYNILAKKQMNNAGNKFSQEKIGMLINTRYTRLIYAYYMFFKNLQKLQNSNIDNINEQFMNTLFHTIDYYHKTIIQFIYLSYVKNDFIKIGESILNYLEFLIKFKLKTSSKDKYFLKIDNRDKPELHEKQEFKKKIFNKIIKWFNLFDDYISYIREYISLDYSKYIVDEYSHNINLDNIENQTAFMFRINIQKCNFLKGKFCICCKNYNDALLYFIRAAKGNSIVIDGLIKKRSLKHIYKLLNKMKKKFEKLGLKNLNCVKELEQYIKEKNKEDNRKLKPMRKSTSKSLIIKEIKPITFGKEIEEIKKDILKDIDECNVKKEKDIIILIDFNIYDKNKENISTKKYRIDAFIEESILILNKYISLSDRFCVFIFINDYQIICPLMSVNQIDNNSFSKDLKYYKNKTFNEDSEINQSKEYDININYNYKEFKKDIEYDSENNNLSQHSQEESDMSSDNFEFYDKLRELLNTINYINTYTKIKEGIKNEKYIILFSDIFNTHDIDIEEMESTIKNIIGDKDSTILLVGKIKELNLNDEKNKKDKIIEKIILSKYSEKSEIIEFENMKKIKTILSNNKVIKEKIIFPNEIYKQCHY